MKLVETTITLPVDSVKTILNIDRIDLDHNIKDLINKDDVAINSVNAYLKNDEFIVSKYGECTLSDFKEYTMKAYDNVSFFNITVEYANGNVISFICPSYVSFYVNAKKAFISVYGIHRSDTLRDYAGRMVKIKKIEMLEDIMNVKKSYYQFKASYMIDDIVDIENEDDITNLYLNGILVNSPWHNFYVKRSNA